MKRILLCAVVFVCSLAGAQTRNVALMPRGADSPFMLMREAKVPAQLGTAHYVVLNWTISTSTGLSGYHVYRANGACTSVSISALTPVYATVSDPTLTTWTDNSVTGGATYCYAMTSFITGAGESGFSNTASAAVPGNPNPPTAVTATGH